MMMVVTFTLTPSDFNIKEIQTIPTIQASVEENLVLVSNNFYGGEIYSNNEEQNHNSSGSSPCLSSLVFDNNNLVKNNSRTYGYFIHNLSTDNPKVQQIRAP